MPRKITPGELSDPALPDKLDAAFGPERPLTVDQDSARRNVDTFGFGGNLDSALAWLQMNLPRVVKGEKAVITGETKDGRPFTKKYDYAQLDDVSEAVLPLLGRLGLSWRTRPTLVHLEGEQGYRFVLHYELKHVSGERIEGLWPLPDRADPQAVGSVITYARRYCLCAVTGLAPGGDDDGTAAKEAGRHGESLDEASALSLPPREAGDIVAALEPQALIPLANYGELWKIVVARRAAGKPSPIEHDGRLLTWAELFGFSLARRIDALPSPAACRAFFDAAKVAGGDAALPWTWQDQLPSARLLARGSQLKAELAQRAQVVELAIASASTNEELRAASDLAEELGRVLPDKLEGLRQFVAERIGSLARPAPQPAPEVVDVALPEPGGDERDQHWAQVDAETEAQNQADPWPPSTSAKDPLSGSPKWAVLMGQIWRGVSLAELVPAIDAAFTERAEITGDEHASLHAVLATRPEPGPERNAYDFLSWQAETARMPGALDDLSKRVKALGALNRPDLLDPRQARELAAAISARRTELEGKRYR